MTFRARLIETIAKDANKHGWRVWNETVDDWINGAKGHKFAEWMGLSKIKFQRKVDALSFHKLVRDIEQFLENLRKKKPVERLSVHSNCKHNICLPESGLLTPSGETVCPQCVYEASQDMVKLLNNLQKDYQDDYVALEIRTVVNQAKKAGIE